jgi:pimeloyl-ACP methyl ester carboxylesterase
VDHLNFVLVHGNWHDGSAWTGVVERLQRRGHIAHAPTVAGHGPHANRRVSITDCAQSIADYIVTNDLSDVVMVGHSGGGTWISKSAEQISDRLRRLVFCNAFVLHDGESQEDNIAPASREMLAQLAAATADNTMVLPFDMWREAMINDADLALARKTYAQLSPEPHRMFTERVDLKTFWTLPIPKSYLHYTDDVILMPDHWSWHPRMSNRLGMYRYLSMPGSHEVMFTNPADLANKLVDASRD